jgi:ferredoxin
VRSAWHIRVDPVACDAYGYCAELLPEAIVLDEWGYPIVDDRALPSELITIAKRAVRDCPKRALSLSQPKIIR